MKTQHRHGLVLILVLLGVLSIYQAILGSTVASHPQPDISVPSHYSNHDAPSFHKSQKTKIAAEPPNNDNYNNEFVPSLEYESDNNNNKNNNNKNNNKNNNNKNNNNSDDKNTSIDFVPTETTQHNVLHPYNRTISLIASLRGEMGNNLSVLALARLTKRLVERELPGITIKIFLEHQATGKWKMGQKDLTECFVNFRNMSFASGLWDREFFTPIEQQQEKWMNKKKQAKVFGNLLERERLEFLKHVLQKQAEGDTSVPPPEPPGSKYSLPYLTATRMVVDKILNNPDDLADIRSYFLFDTDKCCAIKAEPGETVFHFRNFVAELKAVDTGMVELSPNDTARILFAENNLTLPGTNKDKKVTIIGRFRKNAGYLYADALKQHGWRPRVIMGQTGVQDFCLAMSATTLLGLSGSTYVMWASILGNATLNRWYRVDVDVPSTMHTQIKNYEYNGRQFWQEVHGRTEIMSKKILANHGLEANTNLSNSRF